MNQPSPEAAPEPTDPARLLMVTGPGRSGTSAVTGALSQLGIHVPAPLVDWNRSNQKGFFETRWVVDFQRGVLKRANTYEFDADPRAFDRIARNTDDKTQQELSGWLRRAADGHDQLVIKDPRSVWLHGLWVRAAAECGLSIGFLTMLRHPTEVVGSRSRYYGTARDERGARDYAISKVAGWVNVSLLNERLTRGRPRVYLRYTDLLRDWRTALSRVAEEIGLTYNADLSSAEPHPVDDFISPDLHRVRTGWDEVDVPAELRTIAEEVWAACEDLAEHRDSDRSATFDALTERYTGLYRDAAAIASDTIATAAARAADRAAARTRSELEPRLPGERTGSAAEGQPTDGRRPLPAAVTRAAIRLGRRMARKVRRRIPG